MLGRLWMATLLAVALAAYEPKCPVPASHVTDLNFIDFSGLWYSKERFGGLFESLLPCASHNYKLVNDNGLYAVTTTGLDVASMVMLSFNTYCNLKENFFYGSEPYVGELPQSDYYVLATDYSSYAVTYGCSTSTYGDETRYSVLCYVKTREPMGALSEEAEAAINEAIGSVGLNRTFFSVVMQDCLPMTI